MKLVRNTSRRPLRVPLSGGKVLHLGPAGTGQVSDERREAQFEALREAQAYALSLTHWHEYFKALSQAGFRGSGMITSETTLFYCYAMYLIGRRDFGMEPYRLRELIGRWFFMCAITRRYTNSPETYFEQDLARFRSAESADEFAAVLERIMRDAMTEDFWNIALPNELETSSHYSPALFGYYAALNVLGAKALFSKLTVYELLDPAVNGSKNGVERHHLFPKNHLRKIGVTETRATNQVANYAFVEWADNIGISDTAPADYFPRYAARFDTDDLGRQLAWHALPDGWERMEYDDFLEARRRLMARVTREGFERLGTRTTAASNHRPSNSMSIN